MKKQTSRKRGAQTGVASQAGGSLSARVERAIAPGPFCRDCADNDGRCPGTGELCDPTAAAKEIAELVRRLESDNRQLRETVNAYEEQWVDEHV